jgi:hypothetical protein
MRASEQRNAAIAWLKRILSSGPSATADVQIPVPPTSDVQAPIVIPIVIKLTLVIDVVPEPPQPRAVFTIGPVRQKS